MGVMLSPSSPAAGGSPTFVGGPFGATPGDLNAVRTRRYHRGSRTVSVTAIAHAAPGAPYSGIPTSMSTISSGVLMMLTQKVTLARPIPYRVATGPVASAAENDSTHIGNRTACAPVQVSPTSFSP